ncbi:peroxiredoxin-2F, mitochondrial-like isoform X3 [Phaseolus vulgaris]|uniref:peroxiredoxin-2F, mitochondrial-like isoform X3 n=1 Tax=Phaseolus vulgaris TaxID=3885 RepID=UPI0035CA472E
MESGLLPLSQRLKLELTYSLLHLMFLFKELEHGTKLLLLMSLSTMLQDKKVVIFGIPGAFTGVCSEEHVPTYMDNADKFKAKGIDFVICVGINDPYTMNEWAEKLQGKDTIEFYGDFDGSFHKSLKLVTDLSNVLLGSRSERWSAYVVDGIIKALNVEEDPSVVTVSAAQTILEQI